MKILANYFMCINFNTIDSKIIKFKLVKFKLLGLIMLVSCTYILLLINKNKFKNLR